MAFRPQVTLGLADTTLKVCHRKTEVAREKSPGNAYQFLALSPRVGYRNANRKNLSPHICHAISLG